MKKALALILTLAMVLSLAACGEKPVTTTAAPTEPQTTAAPETTKAPETTEAPTTEAPTEPALEVAKTVYVMNSALEGLQTYDDPLVVRFNPNWLTGGNVGKFAEENFWFEPADDQKAYVMAYNDGYTYAPTEGGDYPELTYGIFKNQLICIDVPQELQENWPAGIIFGPDMEKDMLPWKIGIVVVGPEAVILGKKKAWNAEELFFDKIGGKDEVAKMVDAESYDFICVDGYSEEISKEDLAEVEIFFQEDGVHMDATSIVYRDKGYTLTNIKYIVPHGMEPDKLPDTIEDNTVYKITVFNTAVMDYDEATKTATPSETDMIYPHGGSAQVGYKVEEVLAALDIKAAGDVTTISRGDSAPVTCTAEEFLARYIVPNDSKDRGPYTVGQNQAKGNVTQNVLLFDMGDVAMIYVPEDTSKEAGCGFADILEKLGITDAKAINVVCNDGYHEEIDAADFGEAAIFYNEDRIDATTILYKDQGYTLENAVKLEIMK